MIELPDLGAAAADEASAAALRQLAGEVRRHLARGALAWCEGLGRLPGTRQERIALEGLLEQAVAPALARGIDDVEAAEAEGLPEFAAPACAARWYGIGYELARAALRRRP